MSNLILKLVTVIVRYVISLGTQLISYYPFRQRTELNLTDMSLMPKKEKEFSSKKRCARMKNNNPELKLS